MATTHDEKEFLALLQEYSSDETRKARRNSSTICFIVICAWILGLRINDIRLFGADISRSNEGLVLVICLTLLLYWFGMFILSWMHDREIERERKIQGQEAAKTILNRFNLLEKKRKEAPTSYISSDYGEIKSAVAAYHRQKSRTAKAARYGNAIRAAEIYVPIGLAIAATTILSAGIWHAL
jgi:hypothetical protein